MTAHAVNVGSSSLSNIVHLILLCQDSVTVSECHNLLQDVHGAIPLEHYSGALLLHQNTAPAKYLPPCRARVPTWQRSVLKLDQRGVQ